MNVDNIVQEMLAEAENDLQAQSAHPVTRSPASRLPAKRPRSSTFISDELARIIPALTKVSNGLYGALDPKAHPQDLALLKQASDRLAWVVAKIVPQA